MENKYFTPDISEMYVGCEFEMNDTWGGWKKLILTEDLLKNPMVGLGSGNERAPWYWKFRIPYLTKEQIESKGWKERTLNSNEKALLLFSKNGYDLRIYKNYICRFSELIVGAGIMPNWDKVLFEGKCKDINTFRKICKLLEI